jgi:hypothetical protein
MTELTCVYRAVRPESLSILHIQCTSLKCFVPPLLFLLLIVCPYEIYEGKQICIKYKINRLKIGTVTCEVKDGYHTFCVSVVTVLIVKMMLTSIDLSCDVLTVSGKVQTK